MNTAHAVFNRSLESKSTSFQEIPIVDLAPFIDGSNPQKVADELAHICENVGFLYVMNHAVLQTLIDEVYRLSAQFFALPKKEKDKLDIRHSGETLRGYIPIYGENVDPNYSRDYKECFDFGQNQEQVSPFFGPNLMPEEPVAFRQTMEQYHAAMMALAQKLISAIALSLGLPEGYFDSRLKNPITIQRLLHYPPQTGEVTLDEIGIGAHTDYGFLTILSQDAQGGLQVMNREGEWIDAPPVEGTFVVNIGDLVQTFTNDRYVSTLHRVINTSGKERYSVPFFIDLDFDARVEVLPGCHSEMNPPRYQPYTCGEHKYRRFVDSYAHLQKLSSVG